jgi:ferrochelatase
MADVVVASAHGTVERDDDVPAFVTAIRHGRPASGEIVQEVARRLRLIGGSPLLRITRAQANALEASLGLPVVVGMRFSKPTLEDALAEALRHAPARIISLPLAPQSVHVYHAALRAAAARLASSGASVPIVVEVPPYGLAPALVAAHAECIDEGLYTFAGEARDKVPVVLSAHSLPTRVITSGDSYERDFRAMSDAIAARCGGARVYRIAFQSQGMDGGDWLGPTLEQTFSALRREGHRSVLVAPVGFLSDHVETLYDLDIEARALATSMGLSFGRAPSLNARGALIEALADVVRLAS